MKYYAIDVRVLDRVKPPYFIGAMLRGALGYTLKKVVCINPSYQCEGCFDTSRCLYYDFYERENVQHLFRLDLVLESECYRFGLYLFGDACVKLPYLLLAIEKALKENGLGRARLKFNAVEIYVDGEPVYQEGAFLADLTSKPQSLISSGYCPNLKIQLLTPLRIKQSNSVEYNDIGIKDILRSIHQRVQQLFHHQTCHRLPYEPSYTTEIKTLTYKPLYRKSSRQKRSIVLDGVLGEMAVIGLDQRSYDLLKIGEVIGVGKQTVFGMGKIKVAKI